MSNVHYLRVPNTNEYAVYVHSRVGTSKSPSATITEGTLWSSQGWVIISDYIGKYIRVESGSNAEASSVSAVTKSEVDNAQTRTFSNELEHVAGLQHDLVDAVGDLFDVLRKVTTDAPTLKLIDAMEVKYDRAFANSEVCRALAQHNKITDLSAQAIYRNYVTPLVAFIDSVAVAAAKGKTNAAAVLHTKFREELKVWTTVYIPRSDFGEVSGYLHHVPVAGTYVSDLKKHHHWTAASLTTIKAAFDKKIKAEKAAEAATPAEGSE